MSAATVVDHIRPHKGSLDLFFSPDNIQSLDASCHNRFKQSHERNGTAEIGVDGWPVGA